MKSLCFNGCSHTKGGSWLSEPHNQVRYSRLVADHYGVPDINIAICGDSNDGLVRRSIQYLEENTVDIFIIQYTHPDRCEWVDDNGQLYSWLPQEKDVSVEQYYKHVYTKLNSLQNAYKNMHLFDLYCKSRKQKYIPFVAEHLYEYDVDYDLTEYKDGKAMWSSMVLGQQPLNRYQWFYRSTEPLSWKNIYNHKPTRLFPTGLFPLESHKHPSAEEYKEMAKIVIGKIDELIV
tara:strand:- start:226 stop:924 length:699 start_codon:yes stop_codon:yes gene_type:complete